MWSSKEVLIISIATGFVFCFATIYAQNAMTKYVNHQVQQKTGTNPLMGMGLAPMIQQQQTQKQQEQTNISNNAPELRSAPPGSGNRWTPLPT